MADASRFPDAETNPRTTDTIARSISTIQSSKRFTIPARTILNPTPATGETCIYDSHLTWYDGSDWVTLFSPSYMASQHVEAEVEPTVNLQMTSGANISVCSITLTPARWKPECNFAFALRNVSASDMKYGVSLVPGTFGDWESFGEHPLNVPEDCTYSTFTAMDPIDTRTSSSNVTLYAVAQATFTGAGSVTIAACLRAERVA